MTNSESATYASQAEWIKEDIAKTNKRWKIGLIHNSPFGKNYNAARAPIAQAFEEGGVQLVLMGHNHAYIRTKAIDSEGNTKDGGTVYLQSNAAGLKFNDLPNKMPWMEVVKQPYLPVFTALTVYPDKIVGSAYTVDKDTTTLLDSFVITSSMPVQPLYTVSGVVGELVEYYAENQNLDIDLFQLHNKFGKAKVKIYDSAFETVVAEATVGVQGIEGNLNYPFRLEGIPNSNYIMEITRGGMCPKVTSLSVTDSDIDLGVQKLLPGDVNKDYQISVEDVQILTARYKAGNTIYPSANYSYVFDTNGDGMIDIDDVKAVTAALKNFQGYQKWE